MDVKKEFLGILQDYVDFPVEEVNTEEAFKAASGIDSFVFIEMIAQIESHFGISIPNADLKSFNTISDIIRYIDSRVA